MEVKKKSIFKRILAFGGALLCAFAFCFGIVNISNNHKETLQVSADEVVTDYTFVSSDTYHFDIYYVNWSESRLLPIVFSSNVKFSNNSISFAPFFHYIDYEGLDINYLQFQYFLYLEDNIAWYFDNNSFLPLDYGSTRFYVSSNLDDINLRGNYCVMDVFVSDNFNANVYKVEIALSDTNFIEDNISTDIKYLNFKYYDVNDNYFIISFTVPYDTVYASRTYYLIPYTELSDNDYYNQGFQSGVSSGYKSGFTAGENKGYSDGYGVGKNDGYNLGYNTALSSDHYTFDSLLTAVIDVPVRTFTSLFNFEILGVNLSGFFLGLLTCCIVVAIVRFIL
ncbi:MAG: hypothetical protein E7345_00140 [Clostridiales bacterium]|nr:hypothetical protein [Clostridiales bacterium]